MIVAHRGASRDAPENTVPAFKLAWEQGADAVEGDFRQTKDGRIVCIHDPDTSRVADDTLVVSESFLQDLCRLDVGAHCGDVYAGIAIPTIAEVLDTVDKLKKIYVEVKGDEAMIPDLSAAIEASVLGPEQVAIIAFKASVIRSLKSQAPRYKAFWLSSLKTDESGRLSPSRDTILKTLGAIGADGFSSDTRNLSESLVRSVKDAGYEYHVWTVDDLETARQCKRWGVKSITTNAPGYLRTHLAE